MRAYLGLGSNAGDRLANLQAAVNLVDLRVGHVPAISRVYETAPMYLENQPSFYNAVIEVETRFEPMDLLRAVKDIETELGRVPRGRYGPREIDIDVLAVLASPPTQQRHDSQQGPTSLQYSAEGLTLPHPLMHERRFVLEPLAELANGLVLRDGQTVRTALQRDEIREQDVRPVEDAVLSVHRD